MEDNDHIFANEPEVVQSDDIGHILEQGTKPAAEDIRDTAQDLPLDQSDANGPGKGHKETWTYAAMKKERAAKQQLKQRLDEIEAENEALLAEREAEAAARQQVDPEETKYWLNPHEAMKEQAIKQVGRISRAEFIADHGKSTFQELDNLVHEAATKGHPDIPLLSERMRASDDPVSVMADWAREQLSWGVVDAAPSRKTAMPSNFAGARNVGGRSAPAWSGPPTLEDIFDTKRS